MIRRITTRRVWIVAVTAALGIGAFISPGLRHSHPGGSEPHSHSHQHTHRKGHAHSHSHGNHSHGHAHRHGDHQHSHSNGKESRVRATATHVHFRIFGFEITLFDRASSDPAVRSQRANQQRRSARDSVLPADTSPTSVRLAADSELRVPVISSVTSPAGDWSDWAKYNVARRLPVHHTDDEGKFSRPISETLPPQQCLEPPLRPPRSATLRALSAQS